MTLSPDLQFHKSQLVLLAGEIRQIAKANFDEGVVDKLAPFQKDKLSQAAGVVVSAFARRGFSDPTIGNCIGAFISTNIEDYTLSHWQAPDGFHRLLYALLQHYWYPKGIDTAINYENDGNSLTETGAIQRWYQETVDNANLLEYLSAHIGNEATYSTEQFENCLLEFDTLDFSSFESIMGAIAAIACQDEQFQKFVAPDSKFLEASYPYNEDKVKAYAIFEEIQQLVRSRQKAKQNQLSFKSDQEIETFKSSYDQNIELLNRTASGLYGVVWEGFQKDLGRKVAVKIIKEDMQYAANALAHAKALARVNHPNLVTIYSVSRVKCPDHYDPVDAVIMEWIEGETLGNRLINAFEGAQIVRLSNSIIEAIQCLHENGLVHGDLHPGNAIFTADSVKIIDIDVSKDYSVSLATSATKDDLEQIDINAVAYLIRQMLRKTSLPLRLTEPLEQQLQDASSLVEIKQMISSIELTTKIQKFSFDRSGVSIRKNEKTTRDLYFPHYSSSGDVYLYGELLCRHDEPNEVVIVQLLLSFRGGGIELFVSGIACNDEAHKILLPAEKWSSIDIDVIVAVSEYAQQLNNVDEIWLRFRVAGAQLYVDSKLCDFGYSNLETIAGAPNSI